ncbi:hypothetical protein L484_021327 [Morus notabilis]|uniref:Uncharacterized protein n=1 Tax=Morus notabilis TaxID=981085 RepID=W9S843_9ROSA|nr:hypothetical protein L484_021327 [Morus notabilis]
MNNITGDKLTNITIEDLLAKTRVTPSLGSTIGTNEDPRDTTSRKHYYHTEEDPRDSTIRRHQHGISKDPIRRSEIPEMVGILENLVAHIAWCPKTLSFVLYTHEVATTIMILTLQPRAPSLG